MENNNITNLKITCPLCSKTFNNPRCSKPFDNEYLCDKMKLYIDEWTKTRIFYDTVITISCPNEPCGITLEIVPILIEKDIHFRLRFEKRKRTAFDIVFMSLWLGFCAGLMNIVVNSQT